MNKIFNNIGIKAILIIAGLVLVVGYFGGVAIYQEMTNVKREQPRDLIVFSGLPETTKIQATLENRTGTAELTVEKETIVLTPAQQQNFYLPYRLAVRLQDADGKYHDITWTISESGVQYNILLDGLRPKDQLILTVDDREALDQYYADWSGRLLLEILLHLGETMKVCAKVETAQPFGFCHLIPGIAGAA